MDQGEEEGGLGLLMTIYAERQGNLFETETATAEGEGEREAQRRAARHVAQHYIALAASIKAAAWTEAQRRAAAQVVHNATQWLVTEEREALRAEFAKVIKDSCDIEKGSQIDVNLS